MNKLFIAPIFVLMACFNLITDFILIQLFCLSLEVFANIVYRHSILL